MSHRRPLLIVAIVVVVLVAASLAALNVWDGGLEFADLESGTQTTLVNGLTLTVPPGRSGYYNRWAYLPEWAPVSWAKTDTPIRETWQLLPPESPSEPTMTVVAVVYHSDARPPGATAKRVIAEYDGVRVYSSQEGSQALATVEVTQPGPPTVYLMTRIDSADVAGSLRGLWSMIGLRGAPAP